VPAPARAVPARVYTPKGSAGAPPLVYFHGGGWVLGSLDHAHSQCCAIASHAGCTVVSVDYRLAPESPYPAAMEGAYAATTWVASNSARFKGPCDRGVTVAGASAGGNLAAAVAAR
jgi:acetyl esterase